MSAATAPTQPRQRRDPDALAPILLIARAVLIETTRRRDPYVLLMLMGLLAVGEAIALFAGARTDQGSASLAMNLGLTMAFGASKLLALLTATRQHANEVDSRTIFPLLAKPLGRGEYLLGKAFASAATGLAATGLLTPLALIAAVAGGGVSGATFLQALLLHCVAVILIACLAVALSVVLPKAVNFVLVALMAVGSSVVASFLRAQSTPGRATAAAFLADYLPDFSRLDLVSVFTDGASPYPAATIAARALYGLAYAAVALLAGYAIIRRKTFS